MAVVVAIAMNALHLLVSLTHVAMNTVPFGTMTLVVEHIVFYLGCPEHMWPSRWAWANPRGRLRRGQPAKRTVFAK